MKKFLVILLAFEAILVCVLNNEASAQGAPTQTDIATAHADCASKFPDKKSSVYLGCIQTVDKAAATLARTAEVNAQIANLRARVEVKTMPPAEPANDHPIVETQETDNATWLAARQSTQRTPRPTVAPAPSPQPAVIAVAPLPVQVVPQVVYVQVPQQMGRFTSEVHGQMTGYTWDEPDSRMRVKNLKTAAHYWVRGASKVRILFKKNTTFIPIVHQGPDVYNEVFTDLDRDGKTDRNVSMGVDPDGVDEVFLASVDAKDRIQVWYLVPSRREEYVPGSPGHEPRMEPVWVVARKVTLTYRPPKDIDSGLWWASALTGTD